MGWTKLVLALIGFGAALLIGETIIRSANLAPKVILLTRQNHRTAYHLSTNPVLGYELTPNYREVSPSNHFGSFGYINADGHRDVERTIPRILGQKRVILLGDSVVAGHGVAEIEDTISRNLERALGDGTEILNFGVGGYNTLSESELLRLRGLKYKPDAVLLLSVDNDNDDIAFDIGSAGRVLRPVWAEELFLFSDLFRFFALRLNLYAFRTQAENSWAKDNREAIGKNSMERGFAILNNLAKDEGIRMGVAIWPRFKEDRITNEDFPKIPNSDMLLPKHLAERYQFPVIYLSNAFQADWRKLCSQEGSCPSPRSTYTAGADMIHPNPAAARLAAFGLKTFVQGLLADREN